MKRNLIYLVMLIMLFGCVATPQIYTINDVSRKHLILLNHNGTNKNIFSISIQIEGNLDGDASIIIKDGINFKKTINISNQNNKIKLTINKDWYNSKCIIEYLPIKVTEGNLHITYKFYEL
jgi:hypothetical protein